MCSVSECCGANIIFHDICSECGEHCDAIEEDDEEDMRQKIREIVGFNLHPEHAEVLTDEIMQNIAQTNKEVKKLLIDYEHWRRCSGQDTNTFADEMADSYLEFTRTGEQTELRTRIDYLNGVCTELVVPKKREKQAASDMTDKERAYINARALGSISAAIGALKAILPANMGGHISYDEHASVMNALYSWKEVLYRWFDK